MMPHPDLLGWIVLTHNENTGWQDDWDGILHTSRDAADSELAAALEALGATHAVLGEVRYA